MTVQVTRQLLLCAAGPLGCRACVELCGCVVLKRIKALLFMSVPVIPRTPLNPRPTDLDKVILEKRLLRFA